MEIDKCQYHLAASEASTDPQSGSTLNHLEAARKHSGGNQESSRSAKEHPGGTEEDPGHNQEAPRRHQGDTQGHAGVHGPPEKLLVLECIDTMCFTDKR